MQGCFLGLDVGTSGVKALLLSDNGEVLGAATAEHPIYFPKPGWSEQNPEDWWNSAAKATRAVLRRSKRSASDVRAVGVAGQMHGSVFLDQHDTPLCNALLWNDQRTHRECDEIETLAGGRAKLIKRVQNPALTGYTAPKILWLRNNRKALFKRVRTVLLPKDYINLKLTDVRASEVSDAAGTLLLDVRKRKWSATVLDRLELDPRLFPPLHESLDVIGEVTPAAAKAVGLQAGTPVVAGAGDQAAAAVGMGVVRNGIVSATIGTSGVVFAYSDAPAANRDGVLQSFCHALPNAWCVFGCMLSAGGSLQWLREVLYADRLKQARSERDKDALYTEMLEEAAAAPEADAALFHPYLTGERCPYPHPHARAAWVGLSRRHGRGDLVRAVVEGVTLGMARQIEIMRSQGVSIREVRLAGGAARNPWWRQLQADAYNAACVTLASEEGSALGAALLAAVGVGAFRNMTAAAAQSARTGNLHRPNKARSRRYQQLLERGAASYEALEPIYRAADA